MCMWGGGGGFSKMNEFCFHFQRILLSIEIYRMSQKLSPFENMAKNVHIHLVYTYTLNYETGMIIYIINYIS